MAQPAQASHWPPKCLRCTSQSQVVRVRHSWIAPYLRNPQVWKIRRIQGMHPCIIMCFFKLCLEKVELRFTSGLESLSRHSYCFPTKPEDQHPNSHSYSCTFQFFRMTCIEQSPSTGPTCFSKMNLSWTPVSHMESPLGATVNKKDVQMTSLPSLYTDT